MKPTFDNAIHIWIHDEGYRKINSYLAGKKYPYYSKDNQTIHYNDSTYRTEDVISVILGKMHPANKPKVYYRGGSKRTTESGIKNTFISVTPDIEQAESFMNDDECCLYKITVEPDVKRCDTGVEKEVLLEPGKYWKYMGRDAKYHLVHIFSADPEPEPEPEPVEPRIEDKREDYNKECEDLGIEPTEEGFEEFMEEYKKEYMKLFDTIKEKKGGKKGRNLNMPYTITKYTRRKAKQLGVTVRRSTNPKKKIDVFRKTRKIASIGATGYGDYPTFMRSEGKKSADNHRRRYKMRHEKDRHRVGTPGYYADKLLW